MKMFWWLLVNKVEREDYLKSQRQQTIFRVKKEGRDAYYSTRHYRSHRRGYADTDFCPYEPLAFEYAWWEKGWLQAEEEEEIKQNTIALGPACEEFERALEYDAKYKTFGEWLNKLNNDDDNNACCRPTPSREGRC